MINIGEYMNKRLKQFRKIKLETSIQKSKTSKLNTV